ncbi:hypothetical protein [Chelatococcus asaccharovorans]|uniref:hypothetical protein n=1 Tax=Chelatococcus asaccharovorans TaxID=28210 RepID=UPI00224C741B|nr:hypothetical protein [Chelatococcus asaccharovorans]CAH1671848.1 conserved hypothetical protein [Chelatococcus asaccharovorans]CAH1676739.1 conserved hypothetical protein [Chelatococcus asaccharovorans]
MSVRTIRRLDETLGLLNRGKFAETCDEHLTKAVETLEALPSEKGTATITVTLTITYESGRLDLKPTVKSKLPEDKAFAATPFWAVDGGLSVSHPSQHDMFPRDATERERERAGA